MSQTRQVEPYRYLSFILSILVIIVVATAPRRAPFLLLPRFLLLLLSTSLLLLLFPFFPLLLMLLLLLLNQIAVAGVSLSLPLQHGFGKRAFWTGSRHPPQGECQRNVRFGGVNGNNGNTIKERTKENKGVGGSRHPPQGGCQRNAFCWRAFDMRPGVNVTEMRVLPGTLR